MAPAKHDLVVRSKIWIEDKQGRPVFGSGRYRILEAVDRLHSLQAAAKELKMSYMAVWRRIKASEERLGRPLLEREGRGSRPTPFARQLMDSYLTLQTSIRRKAENEFSNSVAASLE